MYLSETLPIILIFDVFSVMVFVLTTPLLTNVRLNNMQDPEQVFFLKKRMRFTEFYKETVSIQIWGKMFLIIVWH